MHKKRTSNHVEAANSMLMSARAEAPLHSADMVGAIVASKPYEWLIDAETRLAQGELLTSYASKLIAEQDQLARFNSVSMTSGTVGYVTSTRTHRRHRVDLENVTCTCNDPFQLKIPCRHLIAAAKKQKKTQGAGNMEAWLRHSVHPGYFLGTYITALKRITETTSVQLVDLHDLTASGDIKPASVHRAQGAPKRKRIQSRGGAAGDGTAPTKKYKCRRCGVVGHNSATCVQLMDSRS